MRLLMPPRLNDRARQRQTFRFAMLQLSRGVLAALQKFFNPYDPTLLGPPLMGLMYLPSEASTSL